MKRTSKFLYILIIVVLAAVFFVCGFILVKYMIDSKQSQNTYNELSEIMNNQTRPTIRPPVIVDTPEDPTETTAPEYIENIYTTVIHPVTGESVEVLPEFAELYLLNPDLVGWISIEGTRLDYPVVQTAVDKANFYLRKDFYGKYDTHGCIYVREQCDIYEPSDNVTIYGHRMRDGTMFNLLLEYKDKAFWENNQYVRFDTLKERHLYQVVYAFRTTASVGKGFRYHMFVDAAEESEFDDFVKQCEKLAYYDTGVDVAYGDKFITLSTCDYSLENGRMVVVAKLVS